MIKTNYSDLAKVVRERRKEFGLSTQSLAKRAGVSTTRINQVENVSPSETTGKVRRPKPETITAIAKALHLDSKELLVMAGYSVESDLLKHKTALEGSPFAALFFEYEGLTTEQAKHDVEVAVSMVRELIRRKKLEEMEEGKKGD